MDAIKQTVDAFFGMLNARFAMRLPRLADLARWPALAALLGKPLVNPQPDEAPLPIVVQVDGTWEAVPGVVLTDISLTVEQKP